MLTIVGALATLTLAGCSLTPGSAHARVALAPAVTVDAPAVVEGSLSGGTGVTLTGAHLSDIASVTLGGRVALIVSRSADHIEFMTPPSLDWAPDRAEPLVVTDAAGATVAEFDFTYRAMTAVDRQLGYAFAHWNDYNLGDYGDFNLWGGDCMNFASQTLVARGWTPTTDWFNDAQEDWAPAFVHVPSFDEWLASHPEYGAVKFAHTDRAAAMVGHNLDTMYRDLDGALATQGGPNAMAWIWSIPA